MQLRAGTTLSELVDSAFALARRFPLHLGAVAGLLLVLPSALSSLAVLHFHPPDSDPTQLPVIFFVAVFLKTLVDAFSWMVASAGVAFVVHEVSAGREPSAAKALSGAFRAAPRCAWTLGVLIVLWLLALLGGLVVALIPAMVLARVGPSPMLSLLPLGAVYLVAIFALMGVAIVPQVIALEERRGLDALRRAWRLEKGLRWRAALVFLLLFVLTLPMTLVYQLLKPYSAVLAWLLTAPVNAVACACALAACTLLYVQARTRQEGYDLELLAQATTPAANAAPSLGEV